MKYVSFFAMLLTIFSTALLIAEQPSTSATITPLDNTTLEVVITLPATPDNAIYRDYLTISIDTPDCILSPWKTHQQPTALYDKRLKKDKYVFTENIVITTRVTVPESLSVTPSLHITYLSTQNRRPHHLLFQLQSTQPNPSSSLSAPAPEELHPSPITDEQTPEPEIISASLESNDPTAQLQIALVAWLMNSHNCLALAFFLLFIACLLLSSALARRSRIVRNGGSLIIIGAVLIGAYWYKPSCFRAEKKAPIIHLNSYAQALSLAKLRETQLLILPTVSLLESLYGENSTLQDLLHIYVISIPDSDRPAHLSADHIYLLEPEKEIILKTWPGSTAHQAIANDLSSLHRSS
jgi:hypothetical protein